MIGGWGGKGGKGGRSINRLCNRTGRQRSGNGTATDRQRIRLFIRLSIRLLSVYAIDDSLCYSIDYSFDYCFDYLFDHSFACSFDDSFGVTPTEHRRDTDRTSTRHRWGTDGTPIGHRKDTGEMISVLASATINDGRDFSARDSAPHPSAHHRLGGQADQH